jgi:hypothetical protein
MAVNVMDTACSLQELQYGGYGSGFLDEDLDVRKVICTTGLPKGNKLKSNNTQCLEKLCKMGFGSLEAALTTTDVAPTDCISWWT